MVVQIGSLVVLKDFDLCCLMIPCLSKDIRCGTVIIVMYDHTFPKLADTDISPHIKWAVSLMIAYGHFNLPQGLNCENSMLKLRNTAIKIYSNLEVLKNINS